MAVSAMKCYGGWQVRTCTMRSLHKYFPEEEELQKLTFKYISVVTYANLTVLLADVHINSRYLVVVTKEGSD